MFTGIIQGVGKIKSIHSFERGLRLEIIWTGFIDERLKTGESVAIDGVCLSIGKIDKNIAHFLAVEETVKKTTLHNLKIGDYVNLELPVSANQFLGGHIVQGHVDCIGRIATFESSGLQRILKIEFPKKFTKYTIYKGSIAIDGISFTIIKTGNGSCEIAVIPETIARTNLSTKSKGSLLNIEFDMIAKYIHRIISSQREIAESNEDDLAAIY